MNEFAMTPCRRKSQQGIALVSSLLVMVAVLALGLGSLFLTQVNLQIAENVRGNAAAQANAEGGMDMVLFVLREHYREHGAFPQEVSNAPSVEGLNYILEAYERATPDRATIRVRGLTASGAEYLTESLLLAESGEGEHATASAPPYFAEGLVAEGTVTVNGNSTYTNAGILGYRGYTLNGVRANQFEVCNEDGQCSRLNNANEVPVAAKQGISGYTCNSNPLSLCHQGTPIHLRNIPEDQRIDIVEYEKIRDASKSECTRTYRSGHPLPPLNNLQDVTNAGFKSDAVVCVENGGVNFPNNVDLSNVTVIARDSINFNGSSNLDNVTLISEQAGVNLGRTQADNLRVFSQHSLNINNQANFAGQTTLASAGSVTFNGSTKAIQASDGTEGVGMAVIAEGDITFNGASDTYGAFWAGGNFTYNGNSRLLGGVAVRGNITVNGGIDIRSGLTVENPDLGDGQDSGNQEASFQVVSRR